MAGSAAARGPSATKAPALIAAHDVVIAVFALQRDPVARSSFSPRSR